MKRITLTLCILAGLGTALHAQKNKVTSTYGYLKYKELDKAKEAIDAATTNPSTSDWWKTWEYRAQTYTALAATDKPEFKALSENPIREASEAYQKAMSYTDEKRVDMKMLKKNYFGLGQMSYAEAAGAFESQNFGRAAEYFALSADIKKYLGVTDSISIYNASLAYEKAGDLDKSLEYVDKCLEIEYAPTMMINKKVGLLMSAKKDTVAAVKALELGNEQFPGNPELAKTSFNLFFNLGETEKAFKAIDDLVKAQPDSASYYFIRAVLRENIKGDEGLMVTDYQKTIELEPNHFDAYYNLGAYYFNEGLEKLNEANEIPYNETERFEKVKKEGIDVMGKSVPYLEKAHELKPEENGIIVSLKQAYLQLGNTEKAAEMNEKLK